MKKVLLLLAATTSVLFTNCTSNDPIESSKSNPTITAERAPGAISSLPDNWELVITGTILNQIKINSTQQDNFTYSTGKISEIKHLTNATLTSFDELTYNSNGTLMAITTKNAANLLTMTRVFNYTNPNLIEEVVSIYNLSGTITSTYSVFKNIVNGNLVLYRFGLEYQTDTISYDNKLNIFSNLQCLNELVLYYSNNKVSKNNRVSTNTVFKAGGNIIGTSNTTFTNQYDTNNQIVRSNVISTNINYLVNYTY